MLLALGSYSSVACVSTLRQHQSVARITLHSVITLQRKGPLRIANLLIMLTTTGESERRKMDGWKWNAGTLDWKLKQYEAVRNLRMNNFEQWWQDMIRIKDDKGRRRVRRGTKAERSSWELSRIGCLGDAFRRSKAENPWHWTLDAFMQRCLVKLPIDPLQFQRPWAKTKAI